MENKGKVACLKLCAGKWSLVLNPGSLDPEPNILVVCYMASNADISDQKKGRDA